MRYETTLVIGDSHATPEFNNDRFTALGNYIAEVKPDNIVQIGDWGNLESINFFDHGKPLLREGKRLQDDMWAMEDAYTKMMSPVREQNNMLSRWKKKKYEPNRYWLEGNHEYRVRRYIMENPILEGFVPETDLVGAGKDGWVNVDYREYVYINGVAFTHIPVSGNNSPIGGKYVCARAAEGSQRTVVFGHTHRREILSINRTSEGDPHGQRIDGICAGCYFDYDPDYVREALGKLSWWRGLMLLHHIKPSKVDIETLHIDRVKAEYL